MGNILAVLFRRIITQTAIYLSQNYCPFIAIRFYVDSVVFPFIQFNAICGNFYVQSYFKNDLGHRKSAVLEIKRIHCRKILQEIYFS